MPIVIAVAAVVGAAIAAINHPQGDSGEPAPISAVASSLEPSIPAANTPAESSPPASVPTAIATPRPLERLSNRSAVTIHGIGPVRLGMTVEAAARAAGVALISSGESGTPGCSYVHPQGQDDEIGFMVIDGVIARVDVWQDSPVKTVSGIGIGSTEAEIIARFPGQIEVTPHEYTDGHYLTFVPRDAADRNYRIVFETDSAENNRVTQFRAGRLPEVNFIEGCS